MRIENRRVDICTNCGALIADGCEDVCGHTGGTVWEPCKNPTNESGTAGETQKGGAN